MSQVLDRLLPGLKAPAAPLASPVLIYGAGGNGRQVASFLLERGYHLLGFSDAAAHPGDAWQGLPIRLLEDWTTHVDVAHVTLVVAIHNPTVPIGPLLSDFSGCGFARVVSPVDLHRSAAGALPENYWLTDPTYYDAFADHLAGLEALFADAKSKDLLRRVVEFRLTGNYSVLPPPSPDDQYRPADLPRWANPLRFVDCGAYNGDTIRHLAAGGYAFEMIAAFEPDTANYRSLARLAGKYGPAACFPCGLGSSTALRRFSEDGNMASRLTDAGGSVVQCVSLDEAIPGFRPTLIKMDIEGTELDALAGACVTIAESRPALAISVYHRPSHLWEIPELLASWHLDYAFCLRSHAYSSFDLVLYALPRVLLRE